MVNMSFACAKKHKRTRRAGRGKPTALARACKWSSLEAEFFDRWQQFAPNSPAPEHDAGDIVENRRFRGDFVWREQRVIVELEGGIFSRGRHTRGVGYEADCDKYNLLTATGWRVLRFTRGMLRRDPIGCIALVQSLVDPLPIVELPIQRIKS